MTRRGPAAFLFRAAACAASFLSLTLSCSEKPSGPNIVLVVLDTVRRDYAGALLDGEEGSGGPLADLARAGTVFRSAWAAAPWTVPSHASIFTGMLPSEHGCTSRSLRFDTRNETLAEILGRAGYRTAAFHSNPWLTGELTGLLDGFDLRHASPFEWPQRPEHDQGGSRTVEAAREWLQERAEDEPFFLFVNFLEAHLPYNPHRPYREEELPDLASYDVITTEWANEWNAGLRRNEDVDWTRVRRLYRGDVAFAELYLGELIASLRRAGVYEECVLIVTSDHGENLGEHGLMDHQFGVHETLLAVPLLIRAPGRLEAGVRHDPVLLTDLFATILDLAGIEHGPPPPHSRSLLDGPADAGRPIPAQYAGPPPTHRKLLQSLCPGLDMETIGRAFATVRSGAMRLTEGSDGSLELHDLSADPGQERNLTAARPEIARALKERLPPLPTRSVEELEGGGLPRIDPETASLLRALGYTQ